MDRVDQILDVLGEKRLPAWKFLHPRTAATILKLEAEGVLNRRSSRDVVRQCANMGIENALKHMA